MKKLQEEILTWQRLTFPNATLTAILTKLMEELRELEESLIFDNQYDITDEIADVFIVSCSLLNRLGVDFEEVVQRKMRINRSRVWGDEDKNGDRPRRK